MTENPDKNKVVKGFVGKRGKPYAIAVEKDCHDGTITTLTPKHRVLKNKESSFTEGTPDTLRRQILKNRSTCAIEVHSLVRGGAASGSVSSGVGVVAVSGAGGPERPTPPSTTETNQTPPGVGSGGEGVASLPSDPPPEETAETNQAPGGERVASSPSDPPPEETAETNQAPGGERVASSPSDPPPEETAETNQAPEGEAVVSLPSEPPPEETAETNQAPGGGVAAPPSDPPASESETNKTATPPTQGASDSFKEAGSGENESSCSGTESMSKLRKEEVMMMMKEELRTMMKEEVMMMKEELRTMMKEGVMMMKEELRTMMKEELELMTMRKETKHSSRTGKTVSKPNGRQAAAIALQKVATVTCKLCAWHGCTSDVGFAKHMKSKHCTEQYLFITPPEYEEATVKEGAVLVAESGKENDDSVEFKIGQQVELYQDDDIVAEGRVVHLPPCSVHNHLLTSYEVKVEVSKVHKPTVHPTHGYDIEEGAFTAWNLKNIAIKT